MWGSTVTAHHAPENTSTIPSVDRAVGCFEVVQLRCSVYIILCVKLTGTAADHTSPPTSSVQSVTGLLGELYVSRIAGALSTRSRYNSATIIAPRFLLFIETNVNITFFFFFGSRV